MGHESSRYVAISRPWGFSISVHCFKSSPVLPTSYLHWHPQFHHPFSYLVVSTQFQKTVKLKKSQIDVKLHHFQRKLAVDIKKQIFKITYLSSWKGKHMYISQCTPWFPSRRETLPSAHWQLWSTPQHRKPKTDTSWSWVDQIDKVIPC